MASTDPLSDHKFYLGQTYFDLRQIGGRGSFVRGEVCCFTDAEVEQIEAIAPGALRPVPHRDCECQETC